MPKKLSAEEVKSLSASLAQLRGDNEKVQAQLEQTLLSSSKISKKVEKDLQKLLVQSIKGLNAKKERVEALAASYDTLDDARKAEFKSLKSEIKETETARTAAIKLIQSKKEMGTQAVFLSRKTNELTQKLSRFSSAVGIVGFAVESLVKLYKNWAELQQKTTEALGHAAQQMGFTAREMVAFQSRMEGMRKTFSRLEGDVDGIAMSAQHLTQVSLVLRTNMQTLGEGVEAAMLRAGRGFGVGAEGAGELFRLLETGVAGAETFLDDFGAGMLKFASSITANASQMVSDFLDAKDSVAQFGSAGEETFRRAAMMANEFGFETRRIFDMMKQFDTFGQASQSVNQLNAMLGTSISSFELMMEQDPARRLEMIRQAISNQGLTWNTMSRQARQALSQITGQEESILARVFGEGRSLRDIEREQRAAAKRQQAQEEQRISNQEMMNRLLDRTSVIFETWDRFMQRIWNLLSEKLDPVFSIIHEEIVGIAEQFHDWVENTQDGEKFIEGIGDGIRDIAQWIRTIDWANLWRETKETWKEWEPTVKKIGEVVISVLEFARDNPEVLAVVFGAAVLTRFADGLQGIATLMSPTGAILLGAAALAGAYADAAKNLDRLHERSEELAKKRNEGMATSAERREIEEGGTVAFSNLADVAGSHGSFLGGNIMQTAGHLGAGIFDFLGADDFANRIRTNAAANRAGAEGNIQSLIRTALAGGTDPDLIYQSLLSQARSNPEANILIRRSLGLGREDELALPLAREIANTSVVELGGANLDNQISASGTVPPSATTSAPVTQTTASSGGSASSNQPIVIHNNTSLQLNDREIGRSLGTTLVNTARR